MTDALSPSRTALRRSAPLDRSVLKVPVKVGPRRPPQRLAAHRGRRTSDLSGGRLQALAVNVTCSRRAERSAIGSEDFRAKLYRTRHLARAQMFETIDLCERRRLVTPVTTTGVGAPLCGDIWPATNQSCPSAAPTRPRIRKGP